MTDAQIVSPLSREIYEHMVMCLYDMPPAQRERAAWVMNEEWFEELKMAGDERGPWWDYAAGEAKLIFGKPYFVTKDGGVPHLIAD